MTGGENKRARENVEKLDQELKLNELILNPQVLAHILDSRTDSITV